MNVIETQVDECTMISGSTAMFVKDSTKGADERKRKNDRLVAFGTERRV